MNYKHLFSGMLFAFGVFAFTSCDKKDIPILEEAGIYVPSIPKDNPEDVSPELPAEANTVIPNVSYTIEKENGYNVVRINMTGIEDPEAANAWVRLYGTGMSGQNTWVTIDGQPKGFTVKNTIDDANADTAPVDLVFLVDNSGSMSEEANALARDIHEWATKLSATLDIRFGVVGFGYQVGAQYPRLVNGYGVSGALNLTTVDALGAYLNDRSMYGTSRTVGYAGPDADVLEATAKKDEYYKAGGECGIQALRFADENFAFREGSNRVYVILTDDNNYPGGNPDISIDYVKNPDTWPTDKGTIHAVISNTQEEIIYWGSYVGEGYYELPWLPSDYTGGTVLYVPSNFSGVTLDDLPVTGALKNSYLIRVTNIEDLFDGLPHVVKITILSPNGTIRAEREFSIVFEK